MAWAGNYIGDWAGGWLGGIVIPSSATGSIGPEGAPTYLRIEDRNGIRFQSVSEQVRMSIGLPAGFEVGGSVVSIRSGVPVSVKG